VGSVLIGFVGVWQWRRPWAALTELLVVEGGSERSRHWG